MAQASNPPHIPSPHPTAVSPLPLPCGTAAAAGSMGATDKQTDISLVITHATGKSTIQNMVFINIHMCWTYNDYYCFSMTEVTEALGNQVDAKWKHFGSCLRFDSTLTDTIEKNNRECSDCMLDLVTKWVNKDEGTGDLPRTWETVVKAVKISGRIQLARELAEHYGVTISQ